VATLSAAPVASSSTDTLMATLSAAPVASSSTDTLMGLTPECNNMTVVRTSEEGEQLRAWHQDDHCNIVEGGLYMITIGAQQQYCGTVIRNFPNTAHGMVHTHMKEYHNKLLIGKHKNSRLQNAFAAMVDKSWESFCSCVTWKAVRRGMRTFREFDADLLRMETKLFGSMNCNNGAARPTLRNLSSWKCARLQCGRDVHEVKDVHGDFCRSCCRKRNYQAGKSRT